MMTIEEERAELWLLAKGILQDSRVDADEAKVIKRWLEEHQKDGEFAMLISRLDAFLADGLIDPRESAAIADSIGRTLANMARISKPH
ncbi:MAG: hypothetical protein J6W80_00445 [Kiritimatiellae bacterium]|nr:hypothetical protein [Kiritimatiellia bacterium]